MPLTSASPAPVDAARKRRPRGEPRRLLIAAAQELFNRRGYASTSTREIADTADVSETLMFRYFGSKAGLFREAMVEPFVELVDREIALRKANPHRFESPDKEARKFIADMYDVFREHRALAALLFVGDVLTESELAESGVLDEVRVQIDRLVRFSVEEAQAQGADIPTRVYELSTRAAIAMIAGMATFGTWYFGKKRPSRDVILDELTTWVNLRYGPTLDAQLPKGADTRAKRSRTSK
jgi:AcrR family transcriptional regulator